MVLLQRCQRKFQNLRPVVALTSRESQNLTQFYKNGVNAYVVKPVNFSELITAVKQRGFFWVQSTNRRRIRVTGTWFDLDRRGWGRTNTRRHDSARPPKATRRTGRLYSGHWRMTVFVSASPRQGRFLQSAFDSSSGSEYRIFLVRSVSNLAGRRTEPR